MNWILLLVPIFLLEFAIIGASPSPVHKIINVGVLFSTKIDPALFNFTSNSVADKFTYRASMANYPDLPAFLKYMYSNERRVGYLYGTPTDKYANNQIELEIVCLNKQTYETRIQKMVLKIVPKMKMRNVVQMKIDNLDWVNLMDPGRISDLKNIYAKELWPSSPVDLNVVFLESSVKMGNRLPASPQLKDGVIIQLGSNKEFSERLKDLQEEVRPLYKMNTCTFKRTSVSNFFEQEGFKLDWCAFKLLVDDGNGPTISDDNKLKGADSRNVVEPWQGLKYDEVPERNYIDELAFTIAIPGMIFAVLLAVLSAILCFHHESIRDDYSEYFFENIFHICTDLRTRSPRTVPTVVHFSSDSTSNQFKTTTTTTLKSLRDAPGTFPDDVSINSQSPQCSRSEATPHHHLSSTYLRPKPPPYKSSGQSLNIAGPSTSQDIDI